MHLSFSSSPPCCPITLVLLDEKGASFGALPEGCSDLCDLPVLKKGQVREIFLSNNKKLLCLGCGSLPTERGETENLGGFVAQTLLALPQGEFGLCTKGVSKEMVEAFSLGVFLRMWRFEGYQTHFRPLTPIPNSSLVISHPEAAALASSSEDLQCLADCVGWSRTLINQPGNVLFPSAFVDHILGLKSLGLSIEILDKAQLEKMGAGALLGVAQGSQHPPFIAVMHWKGGEEGKAPLAFVGKGITFDSGGISLKPSKDMGDMKMDMTGAAVVSGLMRRLARRKAPVNAVGIVALAENMPSGTAQRPGDIVTSLSGQTIEVLDTDAEGRLILADALWLAVERFSPAVLIDLATLTGAVRVALGPKFAGLFSNQDGLAATLTEAGQKVGESLWRLPLCKEYDEAMNGMFSDLANIAPPGHGAGSSTAAQFLQRFVKNVPWAHLDIAGVSFLSKDTARFSKGGIPFGLMLLDHWVKEHYEVS